MSLPGDSRSVRNWRRGPLAHSSPEQEGWSASIQREKEARWVLGQFIADLVNVRFPSSVSS